MKYILKRWQDSWDQQSHNKLQEIHSLVGKTPCSYVQNGKDFDLILNFGVLTPLTAIF